MNSTSISNATTPVSAPANRYAEWRRSDIPIFPFRPLAIDLSRVPEDRQREVTELCFKRYKESLVSFDQAIADAALAYVREEGDSQSGRPGPLLLFARTFSRRIYHLYSLYCRYEMEKGTPMLPVDAGQLKNHGFVTEEILRMQSGCRELMGIVDSVKRGLSTDQYEEFFKALTSLAGRKKFAELNPDKPALLEAIRKYEAIEEWALIDRACFMIFKSGHFGVREVEFQLDAIAAMKPEANASLDSRILMEIRHLVAGEGMGPSGALGCLGSNPLAYRNMVCSGDPKHPEGEFRALMYFAYRNSFFINACARDAGFRAFANQQLQAAGANWQIDEDFVAAMRAREPKSLLPVFCYGPMASLNPFIREYSSNPEFYKNYPLPRLLDVMSGEAPWDASFRHPLSPRELMGLTGDFRLQAISPHTHVNMRSGGARFRIKEAGEMTEDSPREIAAKQYVERCQALGLPMLSSISGTFDQMASMVGFVQAALTPQALETLKVALIAFMVPGRDHTVDEILTTALAYGLHYEPGPEFERFIYPSAGDQFLTRVHAAIAKRNQRHPTYYLSAKCAENIYRQVMRHD